MNAVMSRMRTQKLKDFVTFPLRAFMVFENDRWGLSSLMSERFYYVAREVGGYCLDVGCGKNNRFIEEFLAGNGKGVDVFAYDGLKPEHIVSDMSHFPFADGIFQSVTFIANINHVPESLRDIELAEAYRCLKSGGNIIITMGNPIAEILVHKVLYWHDKIFGTAYDLDGMRGMHEDEAYYLTDSEIIARLVRAGFTDISKKYFLTQWGLNHLFTAYKPSN